MTKRCISKLLQAGWKLIRSDKSNNTIKVYQKVQNPDPQAGRGGFSWQRLEGPFQSWAATERRYQEILQQETKTIEG